MFAKLSVVATLALAPWAQALLLQIPVDWHSSSNVNVSWSHTDTDPVFALQLARDIFHDTFSIANNLQPSADFTAFQLGVVPAGSYTLRAINQTNANEIFDETPSFTIQDPLPESSTSSSAAASTSGSSRSSGSSGTSAGGSATVTVPPKSTSGFGVTVSGSNTSPAASGTNAASGSSTDSGAAPTNFNNGVAALPRAAPLALAALGVVAGAAIAF
ncbi:hypothetical protein C8Q74DRAFT_1364449 [Fomes fomentarius]|nr:hypothetical protein C8Q74DRAFT_1364449 [Fomes fomentarius]